jgi:hypothetical protein
MIKLAAKSGLFAALIFLLTWLSTAGFAQSTTTISTVPSGAYYSVDGQYFNQPTTFVWAPGSKHVLNITPVQTDVTGTTQWAFQNWVSGTTSFIQNPLIVTADPSIREFHALLSVNYGLSLRFFSCSDQASCATSPGTVYVNQTPYISDATIFFPVGQTVVVQAAPNPGHVFLGWGSGINQVVTGFIDTVTMNAPVGVYPEFQQTEPVNLTTVPAGLQVLADGVPVQTPIALDWGWSTTHQVAPVSPQQDTHGLQWVFSSWSDGGASARRNGSGGNESAGAAYLRGWTQ